MFWIAFYVTIARHNKGRKLGQNNTVSLSLSSGTSIDRPHDFLSISTLIIYLPFLMTSYLTAIYRRKGKVGFKGLHDSGIVLTWIFFRQSGKCSGTCNTSSVWSMHVKQFRSYPVAILFEVFVCRFASPIGKYNPH